MAGSDNRAARSLRELVVQPRRFKMEEICVQREEVINQLCSRTQFPFQSNIPSMTTDFVETWTAWSEVKQMSRRRVE